VLGINLLTYLFSFIAIWLGAGLIVSSVDRISTKLRLSTFAVSFLVLGVLTSTPEFAVGITSINEKSPEIFVGNLVGGIPVIFLLIIPLLAVLGRGIKLHHQLSDKNMILVLLLICAPFLLLLDNKITNAEGLFIVIFYFISIFMVQRDHGLFDKKNTEIMNLRDYSFVDILKILFGFAIVLVSSHFIVNNTVYFADLLKLPIFVVSLIFLSIGTNLPELSIAVRSIVSGKKDIAFGDYLGSAAANTFLLGALSIINPGEVAIRDHFYIAFFFIITGVLLFYFFSKSQNLFSRKEGFILLTVYFLYLTIELLA
jgi:cation:H+ antiporter